MARKPPAKTAATTITFQVDNETLAALKKLEAAEPPGALRVRSAIIRRALIEAAAKVK